MRELGESSDKYTLPLRLDRDDIYHQQAKSKEEQGFLSRGVARARARSGTIQ